MRPEYTEDSAGAKANSKHEQEWEVRAAATRCAGAPSRRGKPAGSPDRCRGFLTVGCHHMGRLAALRPRLSDRAHDLLAPAGFLRRFRNPPAADLDHWREQTAREPSADQ